MQVMSVESSNTA